MRHVWKAILLVCFVLLCVAAYSFFSGEGGLTQLYHADIERQAYRKRTELLEEENRALMNEIDRLRNDPAYIETIARKHLNLVREDEVIFRFRKEGEEPPLPPLPLRQEGSKKKPPH